MWDGNEFQTLWMCRCGKVIEIVAGLARKHDYSSSASSPVPYFS